MMRLISVTKEKVNFLKPSMESKMIKTPLKAVVNASAHDVKEGNLVEEIEPAPFSTVHKQGKTTMSNRIIETVLEIFIYDMEFRNVVNKHEPDM